jgi:peptidyl-prolyl cis-trans isomerase D
MTMLDRMRQHKAWLKWSLGLVVLAFVIFYIPDFLTGATGSQSLGGAVASVEGQPITANDFRRTYEAQLEAYRNAYGANMNEQLLKQLGIDQQILQQMVDERAALTEAQRLGIHVTDEEVRQRILAMPAFQQNGQFIGDQMYQQLLRSQRPPMTPSEFEENVRDEITVDKLRTALTYWVAIPDKELEAEYRRQNDKVKLAMVTLTADSFRSDVQVSDAEVAAYFKEHAVDFTIPEKRKIKYLLVDVDAIRAKIKIAPADIQAAYNASIDQYTTPEQIRASHILFSTTGKDEAAVRAKAEDVLKQARAGADFAALARKYSDDTATAKLGGDLDYFSRGKMVPEFDQAAFALKVGEISGLVKTQYGFHIIKVTDRKPAVVKPLDEVKNQITDQLTLERAQAQASSLADTISGQISTPADLDRIGRAQGLPVRESGYFARDEPIMDLGAAPEVAAQAFAMQQGQLAKNISTSRGIVFMTLTGIQASYVPKLDEVKDKVKDAVVLEKARALSTEKAKTIVDKLKAAPDFDKEAQALKLDAKDTDFVTRDQPLPDIGASPKVDEVAFSLAKGAVSDPITTDAGTTIIKVLDKVETNDATFQAQKDGFREQLLEDRRNRFFTAYMNKAKQTMRIQIDPDAVKTIVGS